MEIQELRLGNGKIRHTTCWCGAFPFSLLPSHDVGSRHRLQYYIERPRAIITLTTTYLPTIIALYFYSSNSELAAPRPSYMKLQKTRYAEVTGGMHYKNGCFEHCAF